MPFRRVTVRPGRSTPADPVWSRFTQIGLRSDSELESVLTLIGTISVYVLQSSEDSSLTSLLSLNVSCRAWAASVSFLDSLIVFHYHHHSFIYTGQEGHRFCNLWTRKCWGGESKSWYADLGSHGKMAVNGYYSCGNGGLIVIYMILA